MDTLVHKLLAKTEVNKRNMQFWANHYILRLQIIVGSAALMDLLKAVDKGGAHLKDLFLW